MTATIIDLNTKRSETEAEQCAERVERMRGIIERFPLTLKALRESEQRDRFEYDNELGRLVATVHVGDPGDEDHN